MCALGSKERIMEIIKGIKHSRAPGVDGVLTTMLKNASDKFIIKLTEMINICLTNGDILAILSTGKMTLVVKKEPSLEVSKKRP